MEFYQQVFGGTLHLNTFGEYRHSGRTPRDADKIMHGMLETEQRLHPHGRRHPVRHGPQPRPDNSPSASAATTPTTCAATGRSCPTAAQVTVPLEKQMWGDEFGTCIDRFGISWMVNIGEPQP